jgi:16S rRNA (uracil1498-N3)-methyltransferase
MHLFFAPLIQSSPVLSEDESGHAIRVLRLVEGDDILITDGAGVFYQAVISNPHPKHCEVKIITTQQQPPLWPFQIHIAIAPPKNIDRMEWFIEKATELGIDAITCLNCRFSERHEIKTARLEKTMISAMKQSQKARLPQLTDMTDFQDFINQSLAGTKYIAHCHAEEKYLLKQIYHPGENVVILIGPEGDFSSEEILLAIQQGFQPVSLGNSRLRTETAAFVACHTIHLINQPFNNLQSLNAI